jgi:hypothetical protein
VSEGRLRLADATFLSRNLPIAACKNGRAGAEALMESSVRRGATAAIDAAMVAVRDVSLGKMAVANSVWLIACNGEELIVAVSQCH